MLQSNQKITALYCRLSQEDMWQGDSDSIINQKMILEKYAKENGFENTQVFADDPKSYSFNCSHYRNNVKEKCTPHRICEAVLDEILLEELRRITCTARTKERQFAEFINKVSSTENRRELNAKQREYEGSSKRTAELNALFKRLYEDNVLGRINNEQFRMLSRCYTDEQKSIDAKLSELEKQIQNLQQAASDVDKFIGLAKKYTRITELTPEILHTFVSKIVIHERRERFKQNTEQQIDRYPYGNPVKSWLPLQTKEARDGARGPGDLGLRGPERSEDIELSSPGMGSKIIKE